MVVAGHFVPALRDPGFAIGGMGLSAMEGGLSPGPAAGLGRALGGGAAAGGVCAMLGIGVPVALGDVPANLLPMGTGVSTVAGIIGAGLAYLRR